MRVAIAAAVALCVLGLVGCVAASTPETERASIVAQQYGLTLGAPSASSETTLPTRLTSTDSSGFNAEFVWTLIQDSASADGYDLQPYLGQRVAQRRYLLKERYNGERAWFETVERDSRLIAAWVSVENVTPGPISLSQMRRAQQ